MAYGASVLNAAGAVTVQFIDFPISVEKVNFIVLLMLSIKRGLSCTVWFPFDGRVGLAPILDWDWMIKGVPLINCREMVWDSAVLQVNKIDRAAIKVVVNLFTDCLLHKL